MYNKLKEDQIFEFNDIERLLIDNKKIVIDDTIREYLKNIYYREILGLKTAIIFINYEFRNEIAEYIKEHNDMNADITMMISLDRKVVSYRCARKGVSVREVAEYFGGKGHDVAATNPITEEHNEEIINVLVRKK